MDEAVSECQDRVKAPIEGKSGTDQLTGTYQIVHLIIEDRSREQTINRLRQKY